MTLFGDAAGGGGCIGVVVASGVGMSIEGGGADSRGSTVRNGGVGACFGGGEASSMDRCRFSEVIRELWEDLP